MVTISNELYARLTLSEGYLKVILAAIDDSMPAYRLEDIVKLVKKTMEAPENNLQAESPGCKNEPASIWNDVANTCLSATNAMSASEYHKKEV